MKKPKYILKMATAKISFVFLLFPVFLIAWDIGYYADGDNWIPWDSSWKEWTTSGSCTSWETYMFLNTTTNQWEFCPDGEFYMFNLDKCASWESSWVGTWAYQRTCFECTSPQVLDLDSLSCLNEWGSSTVQISSSTQFEVDTFCRSLNYYVDPSSSEIMELGTKQYPYRTISPVFSELTNHLSHTETEATIYVKEGTELYIEDGTSVVLNMTKVSITTYSDTSSTPSSTNVITTDSTVTPISQKAAFHIMKNFTVDIDALITGRDFTDSEFTVIGKSEGTFEVVRSSISIQNIVARRKPTSTTTGTFLNLIYLQNKDLELSNNL